jgi:hypothetical protein
MDIGSSVMEVHTINSRYCKLVNAPKESGRSSRLLHSLKYNLMSVLTYPIEFGSSYNFLQPHKLSKSRFLNNPMVFGILGIDTHLEKQKRESWFRFLNILELSSTFTT